jgi:hypothetical protein
MHEHIQFRPPLALRLVLIIGVKGQIYNQKNDFRGLRDFYIPSKYIQILPKTN